MSEKEPSCDKIKRNVKMFMDTYKKNTTQIETLREKRRESFKTFRKLGVEEESLRKFEDDVEKTIQALRIENKKTAEKIVKSLVKLDDLGCGLIE